MAEIDFKKVTKANVYLRNEPAGELEKVSNEEYIFRYFNRYVDNKAMPAIAISLPKRKEPYSSPKLHPFFDNLITEGWLLQHTEKVFHIDKSNRFALLMATGSAPIGAVTVKPLDQKNHPLDVAQEFAPELLQEELVVRPSKNLENFNYCPTCFKEYKDGNSHKKCLREMWGTERTLKIEIDKSNPLLSFARVIYGGSISGAQRKGMFNLNIKTGLLRSTPENATYILKPSGDYPELPENEHVTMSIAKELGFPIPPFYLLDFEGLGRVFAIRRFDRQPDGTPLMMEDMGQIVEVPSSDKYEASYEKVVKAIKRYSSAPPIDLMDFYRRLIFCYFIANADMHLKNWTLVENSKKFGTYMLAPCYDFLNTRLAIPSEKIDLGLTLNGKTAKLKRSDFITFAETIGISQKQVRGIFDELPHWMNVTNDYVGKCLLTNDSKETYLKIVNQRYEFLSG